MDQLPFSFEGPPGLAYYSEFLSVSEERSLIEFLERLDWDGVGAFRRRGRLVRRREIDFIHAYVRDRRGVRPGVPLPPALDFLRSRCAEFVERAPDFFEQAIAARYVKGAGIDWHIDSTKAFGEPICAVSLASECVMKFRLGRTESVWSLRLEPRALLVFSGAARWKYQHHIRAVKDMRLSVTFRPLLR
jgi:alkylated DNA repair protein alkB family protein 8